MTTEDHNSKSSISEEESSSSGSLTDRSHNRQNQDINHRIYDKIGIVFQKLKATDNNLKLMEKLLEARKRTKTQRRPSNPKSNSAEEYGVSDEDAASGTSPRDRDRARSVDSLRVAGTSKSSTVEQLDRLTQSMQDLYRHQRELHEAALRNSGCASADIAREMCNTFKRSVDEESSSRVLAHHLQDIKEEIRVGHLHYAASTATESLQKELSAVKCRLEELNYQRHHTQVQGPTSGDVDDKIVDMRKILERLENEQRVLNGNVEALQSSHLNQRHHNDKLAKVLTDLSDKLTRDDERKLSVRDDSDRSSAKKLTHRLKAKCSDLSAECKAYHAINQEKERQLITLSRERAEMCAKFEEGNEQLAKTINKLHLKDLEVEREKIANESTLQEWKSFHWESQKMMREANSVIDKLQSENDKLIKEKVDIMKNEAVIKEESKVMSEMLNKVQAELASSKVSQTTLLTNLSQEKEKQNELSLLVENLKHQLALVKQSRDQKLNLKQPGNSCIHEKDHVITKTDFDKVLNENLRLQKKWEKLITTMGTKNDHLREKDERINDLNHQLQKTKAVIQTMEHEFREILIGIGGDVDRTVQVLTLNSNESYYQALGPLQGVHFHTKVHLVEIKAKLKWLQDEIRSTVIVKQNNLEKKSSINVDSIQRLRKSVHNPITNTNKDIKSPKTSTPYRKENIPEPQVKFSEISDLTHLGHLEPPKMSSTLKCDLDQASSILNSNE